MATKRTMHETAGPDNAMPMPYVDVDALMRIQRGNFDTMVEANRIFIEAAQAIAGCQSEMMRDCVEQMTKAFAELAGGAQPGGAKTPDGGAAQQLIEKTASHVRQIAELIGRSNAETIELMSGRMRAAMGEARAGTRTPAAAD